MAEKKSWWEHFIAALKGKESEFTSGSLNKAIFYLAIPMVAELIIEGLFAVVDIFCLSYVSQDAVSVVGITESVVFVVYSLAIGMGMGATAMVSRRIGEKDPKGASIAAAQSMVLSLIVSVLISIGGIYFAPEILAIFTDEQVLLESGVTYVRIMLGSNIVIMWLFLLNSVFRGTGEAKYAMHALWISSIINIILDPLLIFGVGPFPELGLEGAAIATCIGRGIGVIFQLVLLARNKSVIRLFKKYFLPDVGVMKRLINVSSGGVLQFSIESLSWIFLTYIIVQFGSEVRSGYFIAFRIIVFSILPSWGIANAAATLVGQNLGAGKPERAEKSVWLCAKYNTFFLLIVSVIFFLLSKPLVACFMSDPVVIRSGSLALKIICSGYIFFGYGMVLGQAFNGAGDTWTPTLWNFVVFWVIQIPMAFFLSEWLGEIGVYISIAISAILLAIVLAIMFKKGNWKKSLV